MKYHDATFSVPVSSGNAVKECQKTGHAFADRKGRCLRCGEQIRPTGYEKTA